MIKKLFSAVTIFFLLLIGSWVFIPPVLAAEIEIYPGSGNATANATSDGWTDNHLVGQTFTIPANVYKINRIRLTNFKLGMAGQNNGGIVQVLLYAGAPGVSQVEVSPGVKTTKITPDPNKLISSIGPVYVAAWKLNHYLADLCAVDRNSTEDYALTELQINDPRRPCPVDWGKGGSTFIRADFDGTNRLRTVFPWGNAYSEATGWQSDTTLEVPFPNNTVTPGGTYYIAIQQNYMQESDYIESGKYNCWGPLFLSTPGDGGGLCDKDQVFVASISTNNPYGGGQAYFNTYYYSPPGYPPTSGYNPATGDLANFKVWGESTFNNAACSSIAAPDTVNSGQLFAANVQMLNTGTTTWTSGGNYHVGSQNPQDNTTWGSNRANLSAEPVGPGAIGTFNFTATAPTISVPSQTIDFTWRMVQDGVEWFGDPPCTKKIIVNQPSPTLGALKITADPSTNSQSKGNYTVSGLRSDSSQGGSNYYNAIQITQNINYSATAKLMGTAFTSKASPPGNQTLSELVRSADADNGFVLIYANKTTTIAGQQFIAKNYYIYFQGGWHGPLGVASQKGKGYGGPSLGIYAGIGDQTKDAPAPQFSVTFYERIKNHTWGTYGYVYGDNGEQSIPREPSN